MQNFTFKKHSAAHKRLNEDAASTLPIIFHLITFVSLYQKEQVIHFKFLIEFCLSSLPLVLFLVWLCWVFIAVWLL